MVSAAATRSRAERVEHIVRDLVPSASQLSRLISGHARGEISRSEGGILRTLSDGPRRVTELAELEGLAQPTTTVLIKELERRGCVERSRDPEDGRAVLVSLTPEGAGALERYRAQYRALLRERIGAMPEDQVEALENAVGALEALVAAVRKGAGQ
ncbi:MAG TPA: MarR family transcriptional regulator [Solirubrobacteraceae bacterium]|nr:MarR family transcriptional regulator [Solirubrobacteraceae bacterium]